MQPFEPEMTLKNIIIRGDSFSSVQTAGHLTWGATSLFIAEVEIVYISVYLMSLVSPKESLSWFSK